MMRNKFKEKKEMNYKLIALICLIGVLLFSGCTQPITNTSSDKKYLEDQVYCKQDSDCLFVCGNSSPFSQTEKIGNCANKYYQRPDDFVCLDIDIGITPEDNCLCNEELKKCEIIKG